MAFIEPMHRNKPNIHILLIYMHKRDDHWWVSMELYNGQAQFPVCELVLNLVIAVW